MRVLLRPAIVTAAVAVVVACGGGDDERVTIYLKARLGPEGPPGQIAPVLTPVERERRSGMSAAWQAVIDLRVGPAPGERASGFLDTLEPATRLRGVLIAGGTATVDLAGKEPDVYGAGAIVFSLTALEGIDAVRLRLDGRPCCVYSHSGEPIPRLTRATYAGWQGEPCKARTAPTRVRCRN